MAVQDGTPEVELFCILLEALLKNSNASLKQQMKYKVTILKPQYPLSRL